jgi:hypothetical protein
MEYIEEQGTDVLIIVNTQGGDGQRSICNALTDLKTHTPTTVFVS